MNLIGSRTSANDSTGAFSKSLNSKELILVLLLQEMELARQRMNPIYLFIFSTIFKLYIKINDPQCGFSESQINKIMHFRLVIRNRQSDDMTIIGKSKMHNQKRLFPPKSCG